jgi:dTDP-4-amino-4,6-dideoxygalactose transaminase
MIPVTKPFLPPLEEYNKYVSDIWDRNWLTNNGPLVRELEQRLVDYLGIDHLLYVSNGTIALQIAIKALDLKGEIITTPFSYVATTSSIVWEGCKPVFADIDAGTLNLDPEKIEERITPRTSGILATHVYGNPCAIDQIQSIARQHNLKVIYDAAHCFGSTYKGKSVFAYGDISTASFHATKLFHTIEGGAISSPHLEVINEASFMRNFGHAGPVKFHGLGINGKNSEFHAAMGLVNLNYVNEILTRRRELSAYYDSALQKMDMQKLTVHPESGFNFAYYPIIFESEGRLLKSIELLNRNDIYPRRYFYPSLASLPYVNGKELPVSEKASQCVLCLPLYHSLQFEEIDRIAQLLLSI